MTPESLLTGENAAFIDGLYQAWISDPSSVDAVWQDLFTEAGPAQGGPGHAEGPSFRPRTIFNPVGAVAAAGAGQMGKEAADRQVKVSQIINAYRVRGHIQAHIDPLGRRETLDHPELSLEYYGLSEADLDRSVLTSPVCGVPKSMKLRHLIEHLRETYANTIAAEFMNIDEQDQKLWVIEQLETLPGTEVLDHDEERRVLRKLSDAENFERTLHTRFPGTKRFSLEGAETLIPLMDLLCEHSGINGVEEILIGMAHRGRLNTLANTLEKPVRIIIDEFNDAYADEDHSGDVKYHLGYSSDVVTLRGHKLHLNLAFNPSHLEAVDPVLLGRARAKQERIGDTERKRIMPVMLHGDAAFAGQGVVAEILQMSELDGYAVGGTIHVVVNNQIGFTTQPDEARSTAYASGMARMLGVPIFHVNGEDPRGVAAVVRIAVEWRQRFGRDVVIDMYTYRKYGHNEGDEPSFTQPLMYEQIRSRPTPREVYAARLIKIGHLSEEESEAIKAESQSEMEEATREGEQAQGEEHSEVSLTQKSAEDDLDLFAKKEDSAMNTASAGIKEEAESPMKGLWLHYSGGSIHDEVDTTYDRDELVTILDALNGPLPKGFTGHAKIKRLLKQRREMIAGERPIDWSIGEQAAYATLVKGGFGVRVSGQDSGRGTFSHRHAVITDIKNGNEYVPLQHVSTDQGTFQVINSLLSEEAVLGFEFGYSVDAPDWLVVWEAQFGDFANGAQVQFDQFISSSEQKWLRCSGLVQLLPHGYEGQGPEHSSGRVERYLQACAEDNIQVANITMPANFFHLIRRQMLRRVRKPLVVMAPKSGLRHPMAVNTIDDLASGAFQHIIPEVDELDDAKVRRVVLCSGKVFFELIEARREREITDIALIRVEMLYPFPEAAIQAELARYPGAQVVWAQEEPKNMGAWQHVFCTMADTFDQAHWPRYAGRPASASPATGSSSKHKAEQAKVVADAFA